MKSYICALLFIIFTECSSGASRCHTSYTALISKEETRTFPMNVGANFFNKMFKTNLNEIIGKRYGWLTIIGEGENGKLLNGKPKQMALCRCDCGKEKLFGFQHIKSGSIKSCGCSHSLREKSTYGRKHGRSGTVEYNTWSGMKNRCYNKNDNSYKWYGERGITMCDQWKNSFVTFFNDMGKRPSKDHSIERIDNNGNYCKENCRWATEIEQQNNKRLRPDSILFSHCGKSLTINKWAKTLGISKSGLVHRVHKLGMPFDIALEETINSKRGITCRSRKWINLDS